LLRNFPDPRVERAGIAWERYDFDYTTAKFDLTLELTDTPAGLQCRFEYPPILFDEPTIARMANHWEMLLRSIASDPGRTIGVLPLLTEEERHCQLNVWNMTKTAYPRDSPVHRLFEGQVKATPDAVAVIHNGEQITYGQLNAKANRLARHLRRLGAGPGMAIAMCMERSIDLVVGELAVLKAGGVYMPIDPTDPSERIAFMLKDSQAGILLSRHPLSILNIPEGSRLLYLIEIKDEIDRQSSDNLPDDAVSADSAAYIMYTSGSTGRPKGVTINHRGIVRLVINTNYVDIKPEDVVSFVSNPMFDTSTFDVWGALLNGARLVIFDKETVLSPAQFATMVELEHITVLFLTTQLLNLFSIEIPGAFRHVRDVLFAGEAADASSVKRILKDGPPGRLINVYGPTENTTFSTWYLIREVTGDNIPIGKPISNSTAYILDAWLQPVPIGVTGEIYLGGDGVALGYHERPDLTVSSFVPDPFSPVMKLYRTGDLACYLPDGNIRFLGRRDHQVKIRGFRVEPDEVKAVLGTYPSVRAALVTTKEVNGEKRLIAYLLTHGDGINIEGLREYVRKKLPEYMVPAHFIGINEFPMTPTGKVDYRSLPVPGAEDQGRQSPPEGPRDELERELANIWAEVLGVASISIDDNFFDIGGHSLAAVRMFARIDENLKRKLPVNAIFLAPTIRRMADMIREESGAWNSLVPLRKGSLMPPLFCINTVVGTLTEYEWLLQELHGDWQVYGLQTPWHDKSLAPTSIENLAAYFIKEVKSVQPEGPYLFLGYCFAGVVAYEMARQLSDMGDEVNFLGFTDLVPPKYAYRLDIKSAKLFVSRIELIFSNIIHAAPGRKLKLMLSLPDSAWQFINNVIQPFSAKEQKQKEPVGATYPDWIMDLHQSYQPVTISNYSIQKKYAIKPYKSNVTVFFSNSTIDYYKDDVFFCPSMGWEKYVAGKVESYVVPGEHTTMIQPPNVKEMARIVEECLGRAGRDKH
jgi:amino acid adenylation domain-containing protein